MKTLAVFSILVLMLTNGWADEKAVKKLESAPQIVDAVELIAILQPTSGQSAFGQVRFRSLPDGKVEIEGEIRGLAPDSEHGFHIHQYGDMSSSDGTSLGDHYDPLQMDHGLPGSTHRHAGDFGNIKADAQGVAKVKLVAGDISLTGQKNPIIGRGLVVHAQRDDGSQPSGNAGARIAVGVIGVSHPQAP